MDHYDLNVAPVVSDVVRQNQPSSAAHSLSVSGFNFNLGNVTATAQIALSGCSSAAWSSGTSLVCLQQSGWTPADASVVLTVAAGLVGTAAIGFTFDGVRRQDGLTNVAGWPRDLKDSNSADRELAQDGCQRSVDGVRQGLHGRGAELRHVGLHTVASSRQR